MKARVYGLVPNSASLEAPAVAPGQLVGVRLRSPHQPPTDRIVPEKSSRTLGDRTVVLALHPWVACRTPGCLCAAVHISAVCAAGRAIEPVRDVLAAGPRRLHL